MLVVTLGGCAAGMMSGSGQGGRAMDGRSYDEARSDNRISAEVNRALVRDGAVRALDIVVHTRDGVVTLSGYADTAAQATRAEIIARQVEGVREVVNTIRVRR